MNDEDGEEDEDDRLPPLVPEAESAWSCWVYCLALSGDGGIEVAAIEHWLEKGPGRHLDRFEQGDVRALVPVLAGEDKRLMAARMRRHLPNR